MHDGFVNSGKNEITLRYDGKSAGINGDSSSCPQSDGLSGYCLGWNDGYRDGEDAR
jgi:hypothetical protein